MMAEGMELTDHLLWLLKQAFYHSLTTINEAMSAHGVSTAPTPSWSAARATWAR